MDDEIFWWRFEDPRKAIGAVYLSGTVEEACWYSNHAGRGLTAWKGQIVPESSVLPAIRRNIHGHKIAHLRATSHIHVQHLRRLQ